MAPLLEIRGLTIQFGRTTVVDGVDLEIEAAETLALVGESGCGKSVTALSTLGLLPPPGRISAGTIRFNGNELTGQSEKALNELRGGAVTMVWQDPLSALNPVLPAATPILEVLRRHLGLNAREARSKAIEALRQVGIDQPEQRLRSYPHQLSGGQRQRFMIAAAIATQPKLIIADEPTTALDVSVQAQILQLLRELTRQSHTALLLITHDLGVVAQMAQRVAVMYAGQIVEHGSVDEVLRKPRHPYTQGLLLATPRLRDDAMPLPIPGSVPEPGQWPAGCRFKTRCPLYLPPKCDEMPPLLSDSGQPARCWFAGTPAWKQTA